MFPKVKMPGVAPGKLQVLRLECWSNAAFWSQGGREVIKVTHPEGSAWLWRHLSSSQGHRLAAFKVSGWERSESHFLGEGWQGARAEGELQGCT